MPPKLRSDNFLGMELIRPLYFIHEEDIIAWRDYNELEFINCACSISKKKNDSKREYIKNLVKNLIKENKNLDINIYRSLENVNINMINGYKLNGVNKTFNNLYDNDKNDII